MAHACSFLQSGGRQVLMLHRAWSGRSPWGGGTPRVCQEAHSPPPPARHLFGSGLEEQSCLPFAGSEVWSPALSEAASYGTESHQPTAPRPPVLQNLQVPVLVDKLLPQEK